MHGQIFLYPHLCSPVEIRCIILELAVVLRMSGVIQLTSVFYVSIFWLFSKVKTNAIWLLVTHQLTEIHVQDADDFYRVIQQSFVRKEEGGWKLYGAKFSLKNQMKMYP